MKIFPIIEQLCSALGKKLVLRQISSCQRTVRRYHFPLKELFKKISSFQRTVVKYQFPLKELFKKISLYERAVHTVLFSSSFELWNCELS